MKLRALLFGLVFAAGGVSAAPVDMVGNAAVGAQADNLFPVVGSWLVQRDGANTVVVVDGRTWRQGTAAPNIIELAGAAFPQEAGTFAEAVKRHASFPLAIIKDVPLFTSGTVTVHFKALGGREDQASGIAFAIQPNGDYLILRANALEDNLILFEFKNGRRSAVKEVGGIPTKTGHWQDLTLVVAGETVSGLVDGKQYLQHRLAQPRLAALAFGRRRTVWLSFRTFVWGSSQMRVRIRALCDPGLWFAVRKTSNDSFGAIHLPCGGNARYRA